MADVRVHDLRSVHKLLESSPKDAKPVSTPIQTITLPTRPVWVKLAGGDEHLVVATAGAGVLLFRISDVTAGNVRPFIAVADT